MYTTLRCPRHPLSRTIPTALLLAVSGLATAQQRDEPVPIQLFVDARDAPRKVLHSRMVIPVAPGPLTLVYPKWIPGEHGPVGPVADLTGLKLTAAGQTLPWRRDDVDMYAVHCELPAGADELVVEFDYLVNAGLPGSSASDPSTTAMLGVINWNVVVVYPAGRSQRDLRLTARLTAPPEWKIATALPGATHAGETTTFAPVSLETLIDSPVLLAMHLSDVPIGPPDGPAHFFHVACDDPVGLRAGPSLKAKLDRLVTEAGALFGSRHYTAYHFLLALSDHIGYVGLEHHESTEIRERERTLLEPDILPKWSWVLAHEFAHSWNGKFRRPRDMVTYDFQEPQRTRLLWVYEGLTEYLGWVLAARSGLWTPADFRDALAYWANAMENRPGRTWRSLEDTATAANVLLGARPDGRSWRRAGRDVYSDGTLIWLEVDCIIRERTAGQRSLDDFCRRFCGGPSGPPAVKPYTFDDVVADLNAVAPFDWAAWLTQRVSSTAEAAPLGGVERSGWRRAYAEQPSKIQEVWDKEWIEASDLTASIGALIKDDGTIADVVPGKPAERAGVAPGMKIVAVNMRRFSPAVLRSAIAGTKDGAGDLELLVENAQYFQTCKLDYSGGARYARLERNESRPDLLSAIITPLTNAESAGAGGPP